MDIYSERSGPEHEAPRSSPEPTSAPGKSRPLANMPGGVDNWENEGGSWSVGPAPTPIAAEASGVSACDALEAALRDMARSFSQDFVEGRVGTRYNTFEHRSRVLRQLAAKLVLMRRQDTRAPT